MAAAIRQLFARRHRLGAHCIALHPLLNHDDQDGDDDDDAADDDDDGDGGDEDGRRPLRDGLAREQRVPYHLPPSLFARLYTIIAIHLRLN